MRYAFREEDAEYIVDLTFDARTPDDIHVRKRPPPPTRVRLRIRRRRAFFAKVIRLGDASVPGAPWFKARLMALMDGTLFVGVDDGLLLVDPATATVLRRVSTGNTAVTEIVPDHDRRRVYVLNDPYDFASGADESNVAAFEIDGTLAWRAPMAVEPWSEAKGYSQIMALDRAVIEVTTWMGRCHLDAENGRVMTCWFTKGS